MRGNDEEIRQLLEEWVISGANKKESFAVWLKRSKYDHSDLRS